MGLELESKKERLLPDQGQGAVKGEVVFGNNLCEPDLERAKNPVCIIIQ